MLAILTKLGIDLSNNTAHFVSGLLFAGFLWNLSLNRVLAWGMLAVAVLLMMASGDGKK